MYLALQASLAIIEMFTSQINVTLFFIHSKNLRFISTNFKNRSWTLLQTSATEF